MGGLERPNKELRRWLGFCLVRTLAARPLLKVGANRDLPAVRLSRYCRCQDGQVEVGRRCTCEFSVWGWERAGLGFM